MTITLPPRNAEGELIDVSYCSACMICKANGWCYQNQDYDELVMSLEKADRIEIRDSGDGVTLDLPNGVTGGVTGVYTWGDKRLSFRGGVLVGVSDD